MPWRRSLHEVGKVLGPFMFLLVFYSIGASADDPIWSRFIESLTGNPFLTGVLASIVWIVFTLMSEPAGSIVDKVGERRSILFGGSLDALGFLLIYFSNSVYIFALAAALGGFGSALFWTAARTHVAKAGKGKTGAAFGAYTASWGLGWSIGPLIGGSLALMLGLRVPFLFGAIILAISVLIMGQIMPHDKKKSVRKEIARELRGGFLADGKQFLTAARLGVRRILIAQILMYAALYIIIIFAPLYFADLNHAEIGAIFFINAIIFAVGSILWGNLADRFSKTFFAVAGFLFSAIIILALLTNSDFVMVFATMGLLGLALALIEPILDAMLNDRIDGKTRGVANGLSQASYGLGASIGPILGGAAASLFGLASPFVVAAALCVIGVIICASIKK